MRYHYRNLSRWILLPEIWSYMAYRKNYSRSSKSSFRPDDYVPTWKQSQTHTCNLIFEELMVKVGVHDVRSFFDKLFLPVIFCTVFGAVWGAYSNGFEGFFWGVLLGASAPAWLVWLCVVVGYALVIAGVYLAAWLAIIFLSFWIFSR